MSHATDEQLLEEFIATGDQTHFSIIHQRHAESIKTFLAAKYLGGDLDTADDVVQETFLTLCENHTQYNREHKLRPWLFSIAANKAIDIQRAQGRRPAMSFNDYRLSADAARRKDDAMGYDPQDQRAAEAPVQVSSHETRQSVRELLSQLSEERRLAIEAVYFGDQSLEEAANELGVSRATVKMRVYRALKQMRSSELSRAILAVA